ncbi:hypothetical protein GCM10010172_08410 [Paractinoplanes ferrugineus]|uniref:Peptidoglycan binding-like domain-containing protein n=1 Tax=Paractinoplanes ferrugineus TaxID=113564 RepID=A0A919J879_9ACTN|nr:peptidoglycan-binding protein [Actinoplanes ferrugineus]GIE15374.1 hypothetical protein Afe05nite_72140 [Actinoplanes ferrugineus]
MSARGMLSTVGTAVGGLFGWSDAPPPADPATVRELFADLDVTIGAGDEELADVVRAFQDRVGLQIDGVAGPHTVHLLVRYANQRRERHLDLAA